MKFLLKGGTVYQKGKLVPADLMIDGSSISFHVPEKTEIQCIDVSNKVILPGFVDVHCHLREPGFSYKETVRTGTLAAARGGYTAVCAMPNLKPAPDTAEHLEEELARIAEQAKVRVYPYGSITMGQTGRGGLSDMEALSKRCVAFSDDGRGVQEAALMEAAMREAKRLGKLIAAHCEDESLLRGGYIHAGSYAKAHGHKGISSESEYRQAERDILLAEKTGCRYHICHVSAKETVELVRQAKKKGLPVTCEATPHHLLLCEDDLEEDGRFKMNPPLRSREDREAVLEGLLDGTIDVIATDHAPHSAEEKSKGLAGSAMGIVGLETAFSLLYTALVKKGEMSLSQLVEKMSGAPRRIFGIGGGLEEGNPADFTVVDLEKRYRIDSRTFLSMGKSTPFDDREVYGEIEETYVNGRQVWKKL